MLLRPRPEVENIIPCSHGGPDYAELQARGLDIGHILDFSVCCNPYPPPRSVRESLRSIIIDRYPDSAATDLRNTLARKYGISSENILIGNGTTELIRLIALTYLENRDSVLLFKPSYGEYEMASRLTGAKIIEYQGRAAENYALPAEEFAGIIREDRPKAIFICNPNNPTGQYLSRLEIEKILKESAQSLLILDEAYVNFTEQAWSSLDLIQRGNVIILRSMTKDYSLAGLRLGHVVASEEVINTLRRTCPPWNVNIAAQKAGVAVLSCDGFLQQSQIKIRKARQYLSNALSRLNYDPLPSQANFFLINAGNGKRFRQLLLKEGVLVRDCTSFGLPEYVRIAPRTLSDCRKLIVILQRLKKAGEL